MVGQKRKGNRMSRGQINSKVQTDICIIAEGSYPYVTGGVSAWVHELISSLSDFTFSIVSIMPEGADLKLRYSYPANLKHVETVILQNRPTEKDVSGSERRAMAEAVAEQMEMFSQKQATLFDVKKGIDFLERYGSRFDVREFLDTETGFNTMVEVYNDLVPGSSFVDYFWSFRSLMTGYYSVLGARIPQAKLYHATCTGFAGLLGARARLQTGSPLVISEHGIYTNERRIEIDSVDWLTSTNIMSQNLTIDKMDRGLRELWLNMFMSYSRVSYEAASRIITLFRENQSLQREDGADAAKMQIIPNGINLERFGAIHRTDAFHPPTVALIGRVVPIKDTKTFIRSCVELRKKLPNLRAWVMGPLDEDPDYAEECRELVEVLGLKETVTFKGSVKVDEYLPEVDVVALTSISEAQPLVILEAGASGIPCVATDVGNCRELIYGSEIEEPVLGQGGEVVQISNPQAMADALLDLLTDKEKHARYSQAIRERVNRYYDRNTHNRSYHYLYQSLIGGARPVEL